MAMSLQQRLRSLRSDVRGQAPFFIATGLLGRGFTPAVTDYFARLDAAGLRVTTYDAVNARLIDRLVGNGGNFWPDSGAFCALAGYLFPGTGAGAVVPLHPNHDAGTIFAAATGDWNAVTGLKGNDSAIHVVVNRNNNADGQNDFCRGVWVSAPHNTANAGTYLGSGTSGGNHTALGRSGNRPLSLFAYGNTGVNVTEEGDNLGDATGYVAISRNASTSFSLFAKGQVSTITATSSAPSSSPINVFRMGSGTVFPTDGRIGFYNAAANLSGTGELAEMDAAITEWVNGLANA